MAETHCRAPTSSKSTGEAIEWNPKVLLEAFRCLSVVASRTTKFCFFVDGLDEYHGDQDHLLHTVNHLAKSGVKICVASRPWNVFEEAFGADSTKKIYLQNLNEKDIERFANEKLRSHPSFRRMDQAEAESIVREIVYKAQGVFLWVRLAVRSLIEGLRNCDGIALLRKRLRQFPSDLDQFFRHMFDSLETVYQSRLSHMFQIALAAAQPLSLVAYWLLDEIDDNSHPDIFAPILDLQSKNFANVAEDMKKRINGRSRGLLETTYTSTADRMDRQLKQGRGMEAVARVDFLHRTVKDFIMTTGIQKMLKDWQEPSFDAGITLCKIMLEEYKARVTGTPRSQKHLMKMFMMAASRVDSRGYPCDPPLHTYTEDFERAVTKQGQFTRPGGSSNPWEELNCYSMPCAFIKYGMRNSFANWTKAHPPSTQAKAEVSRFLLGMCSTLKVNTTVSLDLPSLFGYMESLLPADNPLKTDANFAAAVRAKARHMDHKEAMIMVIGLSRYDLVDTLTRRIPHFRNHLVRRLSAEELEHLIDYLESAMRTGTALFRVTPSLLEATASDAGPGINSPKNSKRQILKRMCGKLLS